MDDARELLPIIGCDAADRLADVIFVHGLDGDARTTWHPSNHPEQFWPRWLGEDVPRLGVWSLNYAVSASAWKGHSMPLYDRAINALDLFELDGIGQRPLAFVCHSLGGLLVKQILREVSDATIPARQAIARQTRLMVFLSTPHSGADIANWLKYLSSLLRTTVSIEELQAHHSRLRELNNWYRDHVEDLGITTFVYCEKLPTGGLLVVDETTANPGLKGVTPVPVDETHVSICKPPSREHRIYRRVKQLVETRVLHPAAGLSRAAEPAQSSTDVQPGVAPPESGEPSREAASARFPGAVKLAVCQRLGTNWHDLADYFEIPPHERERFARGHGPQKVWEWLEGRGLLHRLPQGLASIGRHDLAEILPQNPC